MNRRTKDFETQFIIPGKAVSFRSRERSKAYRSKIAKISKSIFKNPLTSPSLEIFMYYFHKPGGRRMDVDNIAKNIMDGLTGCAYIDDQQVYSQKIQTYDLSKIFEIYDEPIDIVKPLRRFSEYVFVRLIEKDIYKDYADF